MDKALFFSRRSLALTCIFSMLIGFMVFGASPAFADSMTVNLSTDVPDAAPGDGRCDTDLNAGNGEQCTLRAAIMEANANSEPDTIDVNVGQVHLTSSAPEDAGGDLDVMTDTATVTIEGDGVVVDQDTMDRVFEVHTEANVVLNDMTLTDGGQEIGGGLLNFGSATLDGVVLDENDAASGGGIFNNGAFTGTALTVTDNDAFEGAGFYNDIDGRADLFDGDIGLPGAGNQAVDEGGGLFNLGLVNMTGTAIQGNDGSHGGGIYNSGSGVDCCPSFSTGGLIGSNISVNDNMAEGEEILRLDEPGAQDHEPEGGPHTPGEGGGIWNDGWLLLEFSEVNDNLAVSGTADGEEGGEGGGIYNAGGFEFSDTVEAQALEDDFCFFIIIGSLVEGDGGGGACLTESTVAGNVAQGQPPEFADIGDESAEAGKGGGIWNGTHSEGEFDQEAGFLGLDRVDVTGNEASLGGGAYNHDGALIVSESAFSGNFTADPVTGTAGGGAYASGFTFQSFFISDVFRPCESSTCFYGTTFEGNEAHAGGGLYVGTNEAQPVVEVHSSTFNENDAAQGGGIWNDSWLDITNSTLSENRASEFGGGLYNQCCPGEVSSTANTFHRNSAGDDGGNVFDNTLDTTAFRMTILSEGVPNNCNTEEGFPNFDDEGYNLDTDDTCDMQEGTGSIVTTTALLAPLRDNGGPTDTHALRRGSPALDAVDIEACPPPFVDQRGEERPQDGSEEDNEGENPDAECDIGSFEHQEDENFPSSGGGGGSDPENACEDGDDNDNDGKVDLNDPGCVDEDDDTEDSEGTPSPGPTPTTGPTPGPGPGPGPGGETRQCVDFAEEFGLNLVEGTNGDDVLRGTKRGDVFCAKDGNDEVYGRGGNDIIWLGEGDDYVVGGAGNDVVRGGPGKDQAEGNRGGDEMTLGRGTDFGQGGVGDDSLYGREQADNLVGGAGDDRLFGGPGKDSCSGGPGADTQNSC